MTQRAAGQRSRSPGTLRRAAPGRHASPISMLRCRVVATCGRPRGFSFQQAADSSHRKRSPAVGELQGSGKEPTPAASTHTAQRGDSQSATRLQRGGWGASQASGPHLAAATRTRTWSAKTSSMNAAAASPAALARPTLSSVNLGGSTQGHVGVDSLTWGQGPHLAHTTVVRRTSLATYTSRAALGEPAEVEVRHGAHRATRENRAPIALATTADAVNGLPFVRLSM
jgi:hypothetical protein